MMQHLYTTGTALVFLLSLFTVNVSCQDYYWPYSNEDAPLPAANIKLVQNQTLAELMQICSSIPDCVAFNSNGWLKRDITQPSASPGCTLYVKRSSPAPPSSPQLIPIPQKISAGSTVVGVAANFQFVVKTQSSDLSAATARYKQLMFIHSPSKMAKKYNIVVSNLVIAVVNTSVPLQLGVDESYTLAVPADGTDATLNAATVYGAYRGLETFSQLVMYNYDMRGYQVSVSPVNIYDFPRFSHRGILIDTARHYEPLRSIFSVIDSMTYAKLNTFHWHIVDSQSFPMESRTSPALWKGSYSEEERYTQEDLQEVVEYARQRGVRVMIEFDMPGHAASWCAGYPEICPSLNCTQPLNPANPNTFTVITNLLSEVTGGQRGAGLFPENMLHLGGDEVDTSCWSSTPAVQQWMTAKNFTADQTYMYFVNTAHQIALDQGRDPVNWEEVFLHFGTQLDKRSIIHIWLNQATLASVVAAGYRAILSNQDAWYLDHLGTTWESFYMNEPFVNITDPAQRNLILGGEVCMWAETVDTSDIHQTIWPRAAAAAERLWSPITANIPAEFLPRLENFRCVLNRRGIAAAPTNNAGARQSPPGPGACLEQ